jgi:hypothetical protein
MEMAESQKAYSWTCCMLLTAAVEEEVDMRERREKEGTVNDHFRVLSSESKRWAKGTGQCRDDHCQNREGHGGLDEEVVEGRAHNILVVPVLNFKPIGCHHCGVHQSCQHSGLDAYKRQHKRSSRR